MKSQGKSQRIEGDIPGMVLAAGSSWAWCQTTLHISLSFLGQPGLSGHSVPCNKKTTNIACVFEKLNCAHLWLSHVCVKGSNGR